MVRVAAQALDGQAELVGHAELVADVRALLDGPGRAADLARATELDSRLVAARAALNDRLLTAPPADPRDAGALCHHLMQLTELQGALLERTVTVRLQSVSRIHASLARLRSCTTVAELFPAAAQELGACCEFDRTAISRLRGSMWRPEAVWISPELDPELARVAEAYLTSHWMPLGPGALETELIRRRAAALVGPNDPRLNHEWVAVTGTLAYVASPVMPAGRVIGFLQADCFGSRRPLGPHDRDNLWTFAEGFGLLFERTVLQERMLAQRARVRAAFARAEQQFDALAEDEIRLSQSDGEPGLIAARAPELFRATSATAHPDDALTSREREILTLMATGASNSEIADRLVLSEATVKSHVKRVLRKMGAANRADAVSRHLQLVLRERQ